MRKAIAVLATLTLVASAAVWAQGPGIDPDRLREIIQRLDANGDGAIDKEEVPEQGKRPFERLVSLGDTNKNGRLEREELRSLMEKAKAQAKGKGEGGPLQRIRAMDKDNDGKVSKEEWTGPPPLFAQLDRNGDGFLTPEEVRAGLAKKGMIKADPSLGPPKPSTGLVPLTELGTRTYQGREGGLYPGGKNERPPAHEEAGLRLARSVRPLDEKGNPADDGKIVLVSMGMSNTTQEFSTFKPLADSDPARNPNLVIVDGAQGGMTASAISQPETPRGKQYWETVGDRLQRAKATAQQVQVAWIKQADAGPSSKFPAYAEQLENELVRIAQILKERFPNLKLAYLSSRIYGGWAVTRLNPEPYAYESGFSVKWLIEKQIDGDPALNYDAAKGPVKAPWLSWGPYLWADGIKPRADGLTYVQSDLGPDGTHPAPNGAREKVARLLLDFFKNDSTAKVWFLNRGQ